jgi:DNA invertase Pin-like site-specific DNA recombinase
MSDRRRCAIYTRKSTEEGLEQSFNSLNAQREACEAYIKSQHQEGWRVLPDAFDDGAYSGATMQRPALTRLLVAVKAHGLEVVVVYKVDRLTRSLADFAKMVELFDAAGVSFVSVTQAFNTTTSMGRLTLNVLLSFAQFEREVTGERIRDKIAASKQKGMWMGGQAPLGYDAKEGKLAINAEEAETVRRLFRLTVNWAPSGGSRNRRTSWAWSPSGVATPLVASPEANRSTVAISIGCSRTRSMPARSVTRADAIPASMQRSSTPISSNRFSSSSRQKA